MGWMDLYCDFCQKDNKDNKGNKDNKDNKDNKVDTMAPQFAKLQPHLVTEEGPKLDGAVGLARHAHNVEAP